MPVLIPIVLAVRMPPDDLVEDSHDSPLAVVCFGENKGAGPVEYLITQLIEHMCTAANKTDLVVDLMLLSWEAV